MTKKLFLPGPTEVRKEVLEELKKPQIGHRSKDFEEIFSKTKPGLKQLFGTENDVLVSTSSGSGFWESFIRSCVNENVLHAVNGCFSDKWANLSKWCDKQPKRVNFEYGDPVTAKKIDKALTNGNYEAFCMVHNETSTGVASNLEDISKVMEKHKGVLWGVDAVSSLAGMPLNVDKYGIDFCLASSQKALGLPPGLAIASVSKKAYKKAKNVKGKGYYFNILKLKKKYEKNQTLYTPSIPHIYALKKQLERIEKEGLKNRFKRHKKMAEFARKWAKDNGLELFAKKGYRSNTVTCVSNTKNMDIEKMKQELANKGYAIDNGYGKLNKKLKSEGQPNTFRIPHMGDWSLEELKEILNKYEKYIGE